MSRSKDIKLMGEIAKEAASGASINQIAAKVGKCRQTVSTYLRTPELQKAMEGVQEGLISILAKSADYLDRVISGKEEKIDPLRFKAALMLADKLGCKVIAQAPMVNQSREIGVLSPEERMAKLKEIKTMLIEEGNSAVQEDRKE